MDKERKVFLFAAGAIMDWTNNPSTFNITKAILEIKNFVIKDQKTPITKYIYDLLLEGAEGDLEYLKSNINFETIISVIEELIVHYSNFKAAYISPDNQKEIKSVHRKIFHSKVGENIFNYNEEKVDWELIEFGMGGFKFNGQNISTNIPKELEETDEEYILNVLLDEIFRKINGIISKYGKRDSNLEKSNFLSAEFKDMNSLFTSGMNKLKGEGNIMRMYSLNYDRMFKTLLDSCNDAPWEIQDGFKKEETVEYNRKEVDLKNLHVDFEKDCYYNLHGSFYWDINHVDKNSLNNYEILLSPWMQNNPSKFSSIQVQKGRSVLITPIITGYQKAEKLVLTPFRQMQAAFDKDCYSANHIYIIGYSFGDEHINETLRSTARYQPNSIFHIVDLVGNTDERLEKILFSLFVSIESNEGMNPTCIDDERDVFFGGRVILHKRGFKSFLEFVLKDDTTSHNLVKIDPNL